MDRFQKKIIRKKNIAPLLLRFLVIALVCVTLIVVNLVVFSVYVLQSKTQSAVQNENVFMQMIQDEQRYGGGSDKEDEKAHKLQFGCDIYVTNLQGNLVYATSEERPNTERYFVLFGKQYYEDIKKPLQYEDGLAEFLVERFVNTAFEKKQPDISKETWQNQVVEEMCLWTKKRVAHNNFLYIRNDVKIHRRDYYYASLFTFIASAVLGIVLLIQFIDAIRSFVNQVRLRNLLYLDPISGGKNWLYFKGFVPRVGAKLLKKGKKFAIVDICMDKYQGYSSCYGAQTSEELLHTFRSLLQIRTSRFETSARITDAQFAVMFVVEDEEQFTRRLRSIIVELSGMMRNQRIALSTGVVLYDDTIAELYQGEIDAELLHNCSVTARLRGNREGKYPITFFSQEMLNEQLWERKVEDRMEDALNNREFQVYLQPKYNPVSCVLIGAEALVRWISPIDGLIPPGRFIPIFEENGFITQLDDYMLKEVARLQTDWTLQGKKTVPISINISRVNFARENLADHICSVVDDYGTNHSLIELEVTESAFVEDKESIVETLKLLKQKGFEISMDDFGSGYSSLNSLKDLPLDILKLDGEFFRGDFDDEKGKIVVKQAIALARNLKMRVVAEGVEKKEQVDFLAKNKCDMIQGYYFAKPMPVEEFEGKLSAEERKEA